MIDPQRTVTLRWQGGKRYAELYSEEIWGRLTLGGVYLIVENAGFQIGGNECWYFGEAANLGNRLYDHLLGYLFFQYWLTDCERSQERMSVPGLYGKVEEFLGGMEDYEEAVVDQAPIRRKSVESMRLYWAEVETPIRHATERKLIDWLYDHKTAHIHMSNGQRGFSGPDLAIRNDFTQLADAASIGSLGQMN